MQQVIDIFFVSFHPAQERFRRPYGLAKTLHEELYSHPKLPTASTF
jgi:hypothetical protein